MRWVRRLVGVAVVVAVLVGGWWFAAANDEPVRVDFLWLESEGPLWQALLGWFAAGFALAGAIGVWFVMRAKLVQRRYRKTLGSLEAEVHQLRNLPLAPGTETSDSLTPERDPLEAVGRKAGGRGA